MAFRDGDGTITFELLLPWEDVHPYHPWLSDAIGFNLAMAKAVGEKGTNSYRVVDAGIGDENSPREYALLQFEKPHHVGDPQTFVQLGRRNLSEGEPLLVHTVTVAAQPLRETIEVSIYTGEKAIVDQATVSDECGSGLTHHEFRLNKLALPTGGYVASWQSEQSSCNGESGFSILPLPNDSGSCG